MSKLKEYLNTKNYVPFMIFILFAESISAQIFSFAYIILLRREFTCNKTVILMIYFLSVYFD